VFAHHSPLRNDGLRYSSICKTKLNGMDLNIKLHKTSLALQAAVEHSQCNMYMNSHILKKQTASIFI
jgi:hypothetical protein